MDPLSRLVEIMHMACQNLHSRRLAWAVVAVAGIWSMAQLVAAVAPSGLL